MEAVSNDVTESVETFEDPFGKTITLWNGREVQAFPADPYYNSSSSPWPACCSPLNQQGEGHSFNIKCKLCDSELVDYRDERDDWLSRYTVNVITKDGYVDSNIHPIGKIRHVSVIFFRTCPNCYSSNKE